MLARGTRNYARTKLTEAWPNVARLERDNAHECNKTRGVRRFSRVRERSRISIEDLGDQPRRRPANNKPERKRAASDGMSSIYYVGDASRTRHEYVLQTRQKAGNCMVSCSETATSSDP